MYFLEWVNKYQDTRFKIPIKKARKAEVDDEIYKRKKIP